MDENDIFEDELKRSLEEVHKMIDFLVREADFRDHHIMVDGELMEIEEMPKEALKLDLPKPKMQEEPRGSSASSILTINADVAPDGSDISKEWNLLFGPAAVIKYMKEKGENNNE